MQGILSFTMDSQCGLEYVANWEIPFSFELINPE